MDVSLPLANFTPELAAVGLTVSVLFIASLVRLAPLRRLRLPFTVAVMLLGCGAGALVNLWHGHAPGALHDVLGFFAAGGQLTPQLILFVLLPPLVFESAYALDGRLFLKNLLPIGVLAVPALALSTLITGAAVMAAGGASHGLSWAGAFLFGALISATDPVAVVALFKDLGAPKRLGILVEGESLMNDGTAIVLFNILLAVVVDQAAGREVALGSLALGGLGKFALVACGGIAVGVALATPLFALIGYVISDEAVEITLSVVLAYASFVIAEHFLHVSGVMATVSAGLVAGSYGRTKVSPSVSEFMHSFWEYMAFAMNSLIFFAVGLVIVQQVAGTEFLSLLPLFAVAVVVVLAARALGVFGSMPFVQRSVEEIPLAYQSVMWWGGLRGAVSLALALTVFMHPELPVPMRRTVLVLSAGIVLFTLLVNALSMQPLIKRFGLDRPTPQDRFAQAYAVREQVRVAEQVVDRLEREGAVLPAVLARLRENIAERRDIGQQALSDAKQGIGDDLEGLALMVARVALSVERREILRRFEGGELTEPTTRALLHDSDHLSDAAKAGQPLPEERRVGHGPRWESALLSALEPLPLLNRLAQRLRARRLSISLEATRGLYLVTGAVERVLAEIEEAELISASALARVQFRYSAWRFQAQDRLGRLSAEFPEYSACSQRNLAQLQVLRAVSHDLEHLAEMGLLTDKARAEARRELVAAERALRDEALEGLELDPLSLLRRVPALADAPDELLRELAEALVSRTFLEGQTIVSEGEEGNSLFLISRGCAGVYTTNDAGEELRLGVLDHGDCFGEIAALLGGRRRATVRAETPVNLLELDRDVFEGILAKSDVLAAQVRDSVYPRAVGRALVDCPALSSLDEAQRADLARRFELVELAAGDPVHASGSQQELSYVCSGEVRRGGGRRHGEGEVFGAGALADARHDEEAVAEGEVRLLVLPAERLQRFREENPATADACRKAAGS